MGITPKLPDCHRSACVQGRLGDLRFLLRGGFHRGMEGAQAGAGSVVKLLHYSRHSISHYKVRKTGRPELKQSNSELAEFKEKVWPAELQSAGCSFCLPSLVHDTGVTQCLSPSFYPVSVLILSKQRLQRPVRKRSRAENLQVSSSVFHQIKPRLLKSASARLSKKQHLQHFCFTFFVANCS